MFGPYNTDTIGFAPKVYSQAFSSGNGQAVNIPGDGKYCIYGIYLSSTTLVTNGNILSYLKYNGLKLLMIYNGGISHVLDIPFIADKAFTVDAAGPVHLTILYKDFTHAEVNFAFAPRIEYAVGASPIVKSMYTTSRNVYGVHAVLTGAISNNSILLYDNDDNKIGQFVVTNSLPMLPTMSFSAQSFHTPNGLKIRAASLFSTWVFTSQDGA